MNMQRCSPSVYPYAFDMMFTMKGRSRKLPSFSAMWASLIKTLMKDEGKDFSHSEISPYLGDWWVYL